MLSKDEWIKNCSSTHPLALILRGGGVTRYHCEQTVQHQRVDTHTWRLLAILLHIRPMASRELIVAALYHDVPEALVGDVPAPIKRVPGVREALAGLERHFIDFTGIANEEDLPEADLALLKCADYLELALWMRAQPQWAFDKRTPRAMCIYNNGLNYVLNQAVHKLSEGEALFVRRLAEQISSGELAPV